MFYAAAHTGVIFDYNTGVQRLLQGHVNPISATAVSKDKKWIVTADTGPDSMMVVWERESGTPVKTFFNPHPYGVHALDIAPKLQYLVTLSAPIPSSDPLASTSGQAPDSTSRAEQGKSQQKEGEQDYQTISVWDWPSDNDGPICTAAVGTQDVQTCVLFNAWDTHEIATNGKRRVFFWTWDVEQPFQFYSPALAPRDFKQRIGDYTQTIFLPESTQAATGTIDGDVVIWDLSLIVDGLSRPDERRAVKIIRLCPEVSLNVLQVHEKARVVIGTADGAVRFYDYQFRVQAWFEDLLAGSVKSISFERANEDGEDYEPTGISAGVGVEDDFKCPNFLVSTGSALVVLVESKLFYELSPENRRGRLVLQGLDSPVHGLSCHPQLPLVAVCGYSGFLHMWNYNTRSLHLVKIFEKLVPHILQFSPDGKLLAVGFTNGHCKLLKSTDLSEVVSFRDSRDCVTHIAFSSDSCHLALAHADRSLCLYRFSHRPNDKNFPKEWMYSAKHKSHWRPIVGLCFSSSESEKLRLFSVGEDRRLVEYNVKSSEFGGLQIVQPDTVVEQEARPTGCMWYPYSGGKGDNQKVLTMNDEYKFKIWNTVNRSCRKTALAPTYGGPITRMTPVYAEADGEDQFMLYATHEKVLGLVQLPLDGNPNKCMGLIAHPGQIAAISVDYQGQYAFTCGGNDLTVNQWLIDPQPVANASVMGGSGIEPFVKLLDGGEDGAFFCDMKDYFYYSQIRSQDENTTKARMLDGMIPVQEIPHLMCALGYFPTQLEITNMTNEVKYSKFAETGEYVERIAFDDLVKLYVNHRPVFAVGPEQIRQAFEATKRHEPGPLSREAFLSLLTSHGEKMSYEELERCLEALVGDSSINRVLEEEVDALDFAHNVLGLAEAEDESQEAAAPAEGTSEWAGTTSWSACEAVMVCSRFTRFHRAFQILEAQTVRMPRSLEFHSASTIFSQDDVPRAGLIDQRPGPSENVLEQFHIGATLTGSAQADYRSTMEQFGNWETPMHVPQSFPLQVGAPVTNCPPPSESVMWIDKRRLGPSAVALDAWMQAAALLRPPRLGCPVGALVCEAVRDYQGRKAVHLSIEGAALLGAGEVPPELAALRSEGQVEFVEGLRLGKQPYAGPHSAAEEVPSTAEASFTFIELFAGIGGFRRALEPLGGRCVFASEIDVDCQEAYAANFGSSNLYGDITMVPSEDLPRHDLLTAGFPCQPFSRRGERRGFDDARGELFFEIVRALDVCRPRAFLLENVWNMQFLDGGHWDGDPSKCVSGEVYARVVHCLEEIGYTVQTEQLNAEGWVPQKRARLYFVGIRRDHREAFARFRWPVAPSERRIREVLESVGSEEALRSELTEAQWAAPWPALLSKGLAARVGLAV
ncbi:CFAP251 [Symbiodinium natans]|uniref:Cytosine-specific methyltransferase n=1 Tax=Symbiodinium natans TaxID=878477 RepID=A0A812MD39_9DINO|nr:CFAP251 [Symbiodinium natans]